MKIELDRIEVEDIVGVLERRTDKRWLHRKFSPNCKKCKNEMMIIDKLRVALGGLSE